MLCYLADISSMCRLASWQAETTGALGMLSVQEISLILINTAPNPLSASCNTSGEQVYFFSPRVTCVSIILLMLVLLLHLFDRFPVQSFTFIDWPGQTGNYQLPSVFTWLNLQPSRRRSSRQTCVVNLGSI